MQGSQSYINVLQSGDGDWRKKPKKGSHFTFYLSYVNCRSGWE